MGASTSQAKDSIGVACGMSYNLSEEESIMAQIVAKDYEVEYTSQFADAVCQERSKDEKFQEDEMAYMTKENVVADLNNMKILAWRNPTDVGNMAMMVKASIGKKTHEWYSDFYKLLVSALKQKQNVQTKSYYFRT